MPQQTRLDVADAERPSQQRVVVEVNLADRKVVGRPPVAVHPVQEFGRQWSSRRLGLRCCDIPGRDRAGDRRVKSVHELSCASRHGLYPAYRARRDCWAAGCAERGYRGQRFASVTRNPAVALRTATRVLPPRRS